MPVFILVTSFFTPQCSLTTQFGILCLGQIPHILQQMCNNYCLFLLCSGLTVRRLAECGAAGAQHAAGSVRAAAERILLAAYARSPRVVRAQLPPDDAVTRRNLIYRHLFQQFDRIDMQVGCIRYGIEILVLIIYQSVVHCVLDPGSLEETR